MDSKHYSCKIQTISPIFIGAGSVRKYGPSEYVNSSANYKGNKEKIIKRIDFTKFYMNLDENKREKFLSNLADPDYRLEQDFDKINKKFTRYISFNKTSISKKGQFAPEILEHIKTSDKLYVPGSSIKGAIKTAIFYDILKNRDMRKIRDLIKFNNRNNSYFIDSREYPRFIDSFFSARGGNAAQKSIMRFLQISDSSLVTYPTIHEVLTIMAKNRGGMPDGVENYSNRGTTVRTCLETIDKNKIIRSDFTINKDDDLLSRLNLEDKSVILDIDYIKEAIYKFSRDLIFYEGDFAEKYNVSYLSEFYEELAKSNKEDSPVLRIGAGSGLIATSIAMKVKDYDPATFDKIRETFRRQYRYEFPKSRKVTLTEEPLSWVQLNFEEKDSV